jgi:hypothetical protein
VRSLPRTTAVWAVAEAETASAAQGLARELASPKNHVEFRDPVADPEEEEEAVAAVVEDLFLRPS